MDPYREISGFYDCEHESFQEDINFYLHVVTAGPVLEIGAGTGRVLAPLARSGLEVWGVDSSPAMLQRARARLENHSDVQLIESRIGELRLRKKFRYVLLPLNILWHLTTPEEQLQALHVVRDHLEDGGSLIIDVTNPLTMADRGANGELRQRFERIQEDGHIRGVSAAWDDQAEQRLSLSLMYDETAPDGSVKRAQSQLTLRYVHRSEVELLLRLAGLSITNIYGSYDFEPYGADSPNLIVVAQGNEES